MTTEHKLKLIKQEYDIPVDRHSIREEVKIMCNLSEGVEEMGYAKGEAAGIAIGEARGKAIGETNGTLNAIKNLMNTTNWSAENAMHALGISPSEYQKYLMML